jgi:hypothetical protein
MSPKKYPSIQSNHNSQTLSQLSNTLTTLKLSNTSDMACTKQTDPMVAEHEKMIQGLVIDNDYLKDRFATFEKALMARIDALEKKVSLLKADEHPDDNATLAMSVSSDVANLDDVAEADLLPEVQEATEEPVVQEVAEEPVVQEAAEAAEEPVVQEVAEVANPLYDVSLCRRRNWGGGDGCQCKRKVFEESLCKGCFNQILGESPKPEWAEKGTFPHGYIDEPRPSNDLITGKKHKWNDGPGGKKGPKVQKEKKKAQKKAPKKKDLSKPQIVEELLSLGYTEVKGKNKAELKKTLEALKEAPVAEAPVAEAPVAEAPVAEAPVDEEPDAPVADEEPDAPVAEGGVMHPVIPPLNEDFELPQDKGDYPDEMDEYIVYQGVEYGLKDGTVYNGNVDAIGKWDFFIITFISDDAAQAHAEHEDYEDPDLAEEANQEE